MIMIITWLQSFYLLNSIVMCSFTIENNSVFSDQPDTIRTFPFRIILWANVKRIVFHSGFNGGFLYSQMLQGKKEASSSWIKRFFFPFFLLISIDSGIMKMIIKVFLSQFSWVLHVCWCYHGSFEMLWVLYW